MKKYLIPLFFVLLGCGEHTLEELLGDLTDSSSSKGSSNVSSSSGGNGSNSGGNSGGGGNGGVVYGTSVTYQGETYPTVIIGSQTWFQRNLNYAATGSKCGGTDGFLKSENTINCDKYGRLYKWITAMKLPASCNTSLCSSSIGNPHQGICPTGWHIPSNADWDRLYRYADGTSGTSSPYGSSTAGRYLKSTNGWNHGSNGLDKFGFAALSGGYGYSYDQFSVEGNSGDWWSASTDTIYAYSRYMDSFGDKASYDGKDKETYLLPVRCLRD